MSKRSESAIPAVLEAMAGTIAAGAPRGWKRAELHGYATGPDGAGHRGFWFEPKELNDDGSNDIDVFGGMRALHTLLDADDHLTIELEVESRGRYRAVLSERLDRSDERRGFRYVLDPDSVPPEPGAPRPGPDASEAGDPGEAVALLGDYQHLPAPLPEPRRSRLAAALPRDLQALYAVVDGDRGQGLLFHGYGWFGLEMLAELCRPEERWWVTPGWRRYVDRPFINEFGPPLAIRRQSDHSGWIPFATDLAGNYLAVDMAPGPRGRPGQVILIGRDHGAGPVYVSDSVTTLLREHVDVEQHERDYDKTGKLEVTGPDAAPVRGMRPEIRELSVSNAPWVDLGPVRRAPALWQVSVQNCPGADLSPLQETPVEVIDLDMTTIELAGLHAQPSVRKVVLHSEKPIDLRPLLSCPQLYALDLSDAAEADLSVLGGLSGLRYLKLRRPQWEVAPALASLAVAELADEPPRERKLFWSFDKAYKAPRPTLKDAIEWAGNLAGDAADIQTFKGSFTVV